ncbi:hypothetical protein GWK47_026042 [Chionoecetes opilio]|uniref:Uncharacterized protein n=1 Tax=Chionoecetes opilio TaxID=41210 RepID=A0A8J8WDD8_CHIOP|nr:hypothetical protein GWK47_026042 [Chionoecetes opilio]
MRDDEETQVGIPQLVGEKSGKEKQVWDNRLRLARLKAPEAAAQIIQPLQQRRDVAGMCVMYKAHRMQLLQLAELRLNPRARPSHSTRVAHNIDHQVTVPFARTEHYLRFFLPAMVDYGTPWCARPTCTSPLPCTPSNRA